MKTRFAALAASAVLLTACGGPDEPPKGEKIVYQAPGGKAVTYDDLVSQIKEAGGIAPGAASDGSDPTCEQWLDGSLRNSVLEFPNGEKFFLEACYAGLKELRKGQ